MADWSRFHRDPSSSVDRLHERFLAMLRDGRITDGKTLACGLYWLSFVAPATGGGQ